MAAASCICERHCVAHEGKGASPTIDLDVYMHARQVMIHSTICVLTMMDKRVLRSSIPAWVSLKLSQLLSGRRRA